MSVLPCVRTRAERRVQGLLATISRADARPRSPCRMHRVSVFRDDVVFVVYMYQRFFLYPVDHSRAAEGFDDDDDSRTAEGKQAAVKAAAVAALPKPPSPSLKMD